MILKEKGILDKTVLKMISKVLKNNTSGVKGFKVKTLNGVTTVSHDELIQFVDTLADEMEKGNYDELRKCDTCGNFTHPGKFESRGCCFPKNFTSARKRSDYCSGWIPMTEQQLNIRRAFDDWSIPSQTKRTGDGSEDSKKGN